jgi:hypothetical protein
VDGGTQISTSIELVIAPIFSPSFSLGTENTIVNLNQHFNSMYQESKFHTLIGCKLLREDCHHISQTLKFMQITPISQLTLKDHHLTKLKMPTIQLLSSMISSM